MIKRTTELCQIYILPSALSKKDVQTIKGNLEENASCPDAYFKILDSKIKDEELFAKIYFDWQYVITDYGKKISPFTEFIDHELYQRVNKCSLRIKENGIILWSVYIEHKRKEEIVPFTKSLIFTMMYKPLWTIGVLDTIENIILKYLPHDLHPYSNREYWIRHEFLPSITPLAKAIYNAFFDYIATGSILLPLPEYENPIAVIRAGTYSKLYLNRLSHILDLNSTEGKMLKIQLQNREIESEFYEKRSFINNINKLIKDELSDSLW